jgi:hypothetical protein
MGSCTILTNGRPALLSMAHQQPGRESLRSFRLTALALRDGAGDGVARRFVLHHAR